MELIALVKPDGVNGVEDASESDHNPHQTEAAQVPLFVIASQGAKMFPAPDLSRSGG